jgi:hypothetical protein
MPVPLTCAFEVLINAPEQPSIRPDLGGLTAAWPAPGVRGCINLSDQVAALTVLNLGPTQLSPVPAKAPSEAPFFQQARIFLAANRDYPLLRVNLLPGESIWLPHSSIAFDGDTRGRTEVDVQLLIRAC